MIYEDLVAHVAALPSAVRADLARGPLPGEDTCRVCTALDPLLAPRSRTGLHAQELRAWHDVSAVDLFDLIDSAGDDAAHAFMEAVREVAGEISYARCCAIYAAATATLTPDAQKAAA